MTNYEELNESRHWCVECLAECTIIELDDGLGWIEAWGHREYHKDIHLVSECCQADYTKVPPNKGATMAKRGKFVGPLKILRNKKAIVQEVKGDPTHILAQFDDLTLPKKYTHNWVKVPIRYFQILGD